MARGIGGIGQALLSASVLTLLGVAGCGQVNVTENAAPVATGPSGTTPITPTNPSTGTNPGGVTPPPTQLAGDPATATANNAVLTTTRTTVYNLDAPALGLGGWQPAALLESAYDDASSPRVAFDASGNGFAVWTQGSDMIARRYTASSATWAAPVILDSRTEEAHQARLAIDRQSGNAVAVWAQSNGTAESLYVRRFDNTAGTWSAAQLVENTNGAVESGPENSAVAIAGSQMAIAWRQTAGAYINLYLSRLVNGSWTTPAIVDTTNEIARHPEVAVDASGNATVAWRQYLSGEYRIYARRWYNATQTFGAAMLMDNEGDRQARLSADNAGNVFLLWRGGGIYVRRYDIATDVWSPEVTLHNQLHDAVVGELSVDPAGNAMIVWAESDGTASSIYARRYSAATSAWGTADLLETSNGPVNTDKNPTVSLNGNEAVVAWVQEGADAHDNAYAVKRTAGVWGPLTLLESRSEGVDELTSTVNAAGNAAVLWIQADGAAPSLYQARYLSSNFVVPNGATWQSLANTLYGVNSVQAGSALQAAMGGGALVPGAIVSGFPATLTVTAPVPGFYTVLATDTWAHVAQRVYGVTDINAIAQLRTLLGNPTLAAGLQLVVPTTFNYLTSDSYSAPLNWSLVNTTATTYHSLNAGQLTIPLNNWSTALRLETEYADATSPRVAFDSNGNGIAVWAQASDVVARRYVASTATWGTPVVLDTNTNDAHSPRLAIDRVSGDAVVAWAQSDGLVESLYVSSFTASTTSWSAALLLESANQQVSLAPENMSVSKAGEHAAVTWLQSDGTAYNVYLSRFVSGTWTARTAIDTGADDAEQPSVAIDTNGNATVVWRQFSSSDGEDRINARRWDNTTLSLGAVTPLDGDGDRNPRIAFDALGNGFALWGGGAYARRFDVSTGQWGAQVQLFVGDNGAWNGELAVDAAGNALAAWVENDGAANSVYARYYNVTTQAWGAAVSLESSNNPATRDQTLTVSLVNGAGVVAWVQENPTSNDVYAARLFGGVWGSATLLETRGESPTELTSHIDANSNATVLWIQADGVAPSVYAARSNGTPYYLVPAGATWRSIANTLYGVDSVAAGQALQTAMSNPTLSTGLHLQSPPVTLVVTPAVPTYYAVQAGNTWASITLALYGTSQAQAVAALQTVLGNPPLTVGSWLLIPTTLNYSVPSP